MARQTKREQHKEHVFYEHGLDVDELSFLHYLTYYNEYYGHVITPPQYRFARWVEETDNTKSRLFMGHRYLGKTHLTMRWCEWKWLRDVEYRILILSATHDLAKATCETLQLSMRDFPLLTHLVPTKKIQWTKTAFTLDRDRIEPTPSCYSQSQRGNVVGRRCDTILLDDFEVGNNTESEEKRKKLEKDAEKLFPLSNGRVFFVGTPHTEDSIYWKRQDPKFRTSTLKIPIMDKETGEAANAFVPINGTYYDEDWIAETREQLSEGEWQSQYMLENTKFGDTKIKHELVNTFKGRLTEEAVEDWRTGKTTWKHFLEVDEKKVQIANISAFWDWASGADGADDSVVAIACNDENRNTYVLEMAKMPAVKKGQTFRAQCEAALKLCADYGIGTLHAETTGNIALAGELHSVAQELYQKSVYINIDEVKRAGNQYMKHTSKDKRIEHHLESLVRTGRLYVKDELWADAPDKKEQPLRGQMIDFPHSKKDDYLDALAGALEYLTPVLPKVGSQGAIGARPFNSHTVRVRKTKRRNGF